MADIDRVHNTPKRDYLSFGCGAQFHPDRVLQFLQISTEDTPLVVDYDQLNELGNACNLVAEFFGGDVDKAAKWFSVSNPLLGDISPQDMVRSGRVDRLVRFIANAFDEGVDGTSAGKKSERDAS
ncbi:MULTISPECIES: hypothetical protein [Rhodanobacter]|uniref:hypothetical protein n=1 Tax=Rhodanobacter TaxID=75309 RepID=UPI0012DC6AEC|nr:MULTISPECIES: hypothetical protein [Rhodanobacter]UJJ52664.1 hypothetical protein LRK52_08310 [Rhodanobacter denitrificans]UJM95417.1 hypothetical protein LRK32_08345 [Rhodanobacter denitrificans]UJM98948.1 hypothetical protein LRK44_08350 [Rhodanobacter denitrificans]UJN21637.1 hypothetical protein LRK54_00150 [Rhodanobacter denitrificans]